MFALHLVPVIAYQTRLIKHCKGSAKFYGHPVQPFEYPSRKSWYGLKNANYAIIFYFVFLFF